MPSWKTEPYASTAILIHILSGVALGCLTLRAAANTGLFSISFLSSDPIEMILDWFIQCGCLTLIGFTLGSQLITIPLILFKREAVPYTITPLGIAIGQNLVHWDWLSHYSFAQESGTFYLYSQFAPDLPSLIFKPPGSVSSEALNGTLSGYLPVHPAERRRAWYQYKRFLIPTMLLMCLLVIGVGWVISGVVRELALFLLTLLTNLLVSVGGQIITMFAFGIRHPERYWAGRIPMNKA